MNTDTKLTMFATMSTADLVRNASKIKPFFSPEFLDELDRQMAWESEMDRLNGVVFLGVMIDCLDVITKQGDQA